jgi:hypothetical protein
MAHDRKSREFDEPRFDHSRYQQYCEFYTRNPHLSWPEVQRQVDASHEPPQDVRAPSEAYMASLDESRQMEAVFNYSRQSGLDIPQAAAVCGLALEDKPLTLDASASRGHQAAASVGEVAGSHGGGPEPAAGPAADQQRAVAP